MSLFGRERRRQKEIVRETAKASIMAPLLIKGGHSPFATTYKANIGHGRLKMQALLFAIVVADTPEEAGELLLKFSKGDSTMHSMISEGEFILEEIDPCQKGVL